MFRVEFNYQHLFPEIIYKKNKKKPDGYATDTIF